MIPRADALAAMERDKFDVVVIGGGITGAGVALDAASRGYSVALVEKADYASGTSSRSSKLVHGGLRYLQSFDLGLVREALVERQLMVNLAPHLVRPLALLIPAFDGKRPDRLAGVGLNMYDVLSRERPRRRGGGRASEPWSPERHRMIDGAETIEQLPALAARKPTSAYLFYDCQTDDARLVLTVLGEAERFGAVCANSVEATGLVERGGHAAGVLCRDALGGGEFELCADNVVNATGVWADRIRPDELHDEAEVPRIKPSRGTHVTVSLDRLPVVSGAIVPSGGGRFIFVLPWLGRTLIGTTDENYEGRVRPRPAGRRRRGLPARRGQRVLRHRSQPRRPDRGLRGGAAADLDRRSQEVRGHLAQGGAVRDQLGHGHHHRGQADHLAPHGPDGGRPDRAARGTRGAVSHPRDPPGHAARPGRTGPLRAGGRGVARSPGRALRPRGGGRAADGRGLATAGRADRARPARPGGRGELRGPPRADPLDR
ncbi:MAG: glycerol-3-phosphate dehydrogenase/oxidase [Thermoleophilaceae bacterium]